MGRAEGLCEFLHAGNEVAASFKGLSRGLDECGCELWLPEVGLGCLRFLLIDCEELGVVHFDGFSPGDCFLLAWAGVPFGERKFYFLMIFLDLRVA